jgi:cyclopropane fatty-acyl-phospholipid synthase-like methyltransferase
MMTDPKETVRQGYDLISNAYRGDLDDAEEYGEWLTELSALLPQGGRVLDLGCGNGVPSARWLADRGFAVTGVDFSEVQIERACRLVPSAGFLCADMTSLDMPQASFDAVIAFYSLIHVPVEEQASLLARVASWLAEGGYLLAIVGHTAGTGTEDDWFGEPMYWSHADRDTYLRWFEEAGLTALWDRFVPEDEGGHTLILAQRSSKRVRPS